MVGLAVSLMLAKLSRSEVPSLFGLFPVWPSPWARRTPHREISRDFGKNTMGFHLAFSAYYALILIVVLATLIPGLHEWLTAPDLTFDFPQTATSLGWITEPSHYSLNLFGHPGAYLLYTVGAAWGIYHVTGYWKKGLMPSVLHTTARHGVWTSSAVIFMTVMAMIMVYSGMTFLLARGLATVAGGFYPVLSPFVGLLGCFMTGSNTNSNVLFGVLQRDSAIILQKDPVIMAALQTAGAALGSMVAPAKVLLACATAGLQGREGEVMRLTLKYCLALIFITSLIGWLVLL